jgi:hypothetical protein
MILLQDKLFALDTEHGGFEVFQDLGDEQSAIIDIADLFATRLLEDEDRAYIANWAEQEGTERAEHLFAGSWTYEIHDTLLIDSINWNGPSLDAMPRRIPELARVLRVIFETVQRLTRRGNVLPAITDHDLLNIKRILDPHMGSRYDPDDADRELYFILLGTGALRPVFFRAFQIMSDIDEALENREPSPRSSASSNTDKHAQRRPHFY